MTSEKITESDIDIIRQYKNVIDKTFSLVEGWIEAGGGSCKINHPEEVSFDIDRNGRLIVSRNMYDFDLNCYNPNHLYSIETEELDEDFIEQKHIKRTEELNNMHKIDKIKKLREEYDKALVIVQAYEKEFCS